MSRYNCNTAEVGVKPPINQSINQKDHTVLKKRNDRINMDSAIVGSVNARNYLMTSS